LVNYDNVCIFDNYLMKTNVFLEKTYRRNMKLRFFILFTLFLVASKTWSQVVAPELRCIQNDTVKWNLPINNCGAFVSYLVYGSKNPKGPYFLVTTVTNQAQKSYYHLHPKGETWYYFMQSKFNCPGVPILSSDTLTSGAPDLPTLQSVSVEKGAIELIWEPSATKNLAGYIIYKRTTLGIKPIDTVFTGNSFIDKNVMPSNQRETYYVISMDRCGATSIFEKAHRSIQVKAAQDECERKANLQWNKYDTWQNGAAKHEVWIKEGTGNYVLRGEAKGSDTTFVINNLKDNLQYCAYIKSIQKDNPIYEVKTNELCFNSDIIQPTDFIVVKNLNIDEKGEASFTWIWNNDADLDSIKILKSTDGKTFKEVKSLPTKPLSGEVTFVDKDNKIDSNAVTYAIYSLDKCDSFIIAPFKTLNITGKLTKPNENTLRWSNHYLTSAKNVEYELYKVIDGFETRIWSGVDKNDFNDVFDQTNTNNAVICYYVEAYTWDTLQNKKPVRIRSRSNTTCITQTSGVYVPNAFAPRGINQEFRPLISFSSQIKSYKMIVLDRFGAQVFESDNFDNGWNGRRNGTGAELDGGIYTYFIKVEQQNGNIIDKKGTVLLLR
jgi:CHU_C Type IX secretion signal domain